MQLSFLIVGKGWIAFSATQVGAEEGRTFEFRANQRRVYQMGMIHAGALQTRTIKDCFTHQGTFQVGAFQVGAIQAGPAQPYALQVRICSTRICATQEQMPQIGVAQPEAIRLFLGAFGTTAEDS